MVELGSLINDNSWHKLSCAIQLSNVSNQLILK